MFCNIVFKYYKIIKNIDSVIFFITKYRLEYFVILPWSNLEYFVILPWSNLEYFVILLWSNLEYFVILLWSNLEYFGQDSREHARTEFRLIINGPEQTSHPAPPNPRLNDEEEGRKSHRTQSNWRRRCRPSRQQAVRNGGSSGGGGSLSGVIFPWLHVELLRRGREGGRGGRE